MCETTKLWVALIIGLIAAIAVVWSAPRQVFEARGIALPAKKLRQPTTAKQVRLFSVTPFAEQKLGRVRVVLHLQNASKANQQTVIQLAKQLAAKLGANGIVVNQFFRTRPGISPAGLASYNFMGEAIYVSNTLTPINSLQESQNEF